jgi:transmembrane sensor
MKNDIPWNLLERILKNIGSENDALELKEWLNLASENKLIYEQLKSYYLSTGSLPLNFFPDSDKAWANIKLNIKPEKRQIHIEILFKYAAFLIIALISFWLVYSYQNNKTNNFILITTNDSILQYKFKDGSKVWLNRHSKIRFSSNFIKNRNVFLIGEAYFEVAHDKQHPFKVFSGKSTTTVVGTKFNIRSWISENQVEITVSDGKVLFGNESGNRIYLLKGETGILTKNNATIKTIYNKTDNKESWRTLDFYFENQTLEKILNQLSEVYNFHFNIADASLKSGKLTAKFHQRPLSEIMKTLEVVTNSRIVRNNNNYTVIK